MLIPKNWTFKSEDIASDFDNHVREQLPWYDLCSGAIEHIARSYLPEGGLVYDIGASTGNINKALSDLITDRSAKYIGIDNSLEMVEAFTGEGAIIHADAIDFDYQDFDVCVLFLVTMFLPKSKQKAFIDKLILKLNVGGAIIIVDKCEQSGGYLSTVFNKLAIREKVKTTTAEDIIRKELSLSGVQRPISQEVLSLGVEFFRFGEFVGFVIENNG